MGLLMQNVEGKDSPEANYHACARHIILEAGSIAKTLERSVYAMYTRHREISNPKRLLFLTNCGVSKCIILINCHFEH